MQIILIAALYFPLNEDLRDFEDTATIYPRWYLPTVFVDFVVNDLLHSNHCCLCSAFDYLLQAFLWELGWIGDSNSGLRSCTLHVSRYCPACTREPKLPCLFWKVLRWWESSPVDQCYQSEHVYCKSVFLPTLMKLIFRSVFISIQSTCICVLSMDIMFSFHTMK